MSDRKMTGARERAIASVAVGLVVLQLMAGCGTRRDYEELKTAATGAGSEAGVQAGTSAGSAGSSTTPGVGAVQPAGSAGSGVASAPVAGGPATGAASGATQSGNAASGKGQAGAPAVATAASGACTAAKSPIVIGSVGTLSGVIGAVIKPGTTAVSTWVQSINAQGGLNCHPIKYVTADDGGDPAQNQALVRQQVEQDKVIAFVYNPGAISGGASVEYIQQRRVPVIGEDGGNSFSCVNSMFFPIMSSCEQGALGAYMVAGKMVGQPQGLTKVAAISCFEVPSCAAWGDVASDYAQRNGLQVVYNIKTSVALPDYTSICQSAKSAGAQMLVVALDGNSLARLLRSCANLQYKPVLVTGAPALGPNAPTVPQLDGAWAESGVKVGPASDPGVAEALKATQRFAPGLALSATYFQGWVAAKVLAIALRGVTGDPTSQDILNGLWKIKGNDVGGMTRPLTYVKDKPVPANPVCVFPVQIANGQFNGYSKICA